MRFLSYRSPDTPGAAPPCWGYLDLGPGDAAPPDPASAPPTPVVDVTRMATRTGRTYPTSVRALVEMAPEERSALFEAWRDQVQDTRAATVPLGELQVLAPIPEPRRNVIAVGANYREHADESPYSPGLPDRPIFFTKATTTVTGPGPVVVDPRQSTRVDWEVELGVVVGARARSLTPATAPDAVFGYLTANDLSARDQQHERPEGQWFLGKSLDGFCPLGPWLVTADEVPDPQDLSLSLTVNGVPKQQSSTARMVFDVTDLLVELSRFMTLLPGDIVITGTPAGVGDARTPPEYLHDGDVVVAEVEGIGRLRTTFTTAPGA
ncbi:fumarylacetoacetate hydrolase family protein [Phytoactinopolyspora endophytica]|uniref:fumarylacetoacetate hydrolase family protein n=1 Tax=Phytoactinopolyspora endophytica TaxID=1642495 RepID=UPI00101D6677|nr:fumarylacetoacetate hydrolase family protein [Phytoactinopolyspora endophytica]